MNKVALKAILDDRALEHSILEGGEDWKVTIEYWPDSIPARIAEISFVKGKQGISYLRGDGAPLIFLAEKFLSDPTKYERQLKQSLPFGRTT